MNEMVERVARAIMAADPSEPNPADIEDYMSLARAALGAMPWRETADLFTQIVNLSDVEMRDGDEARALAQEWLDQYAALGRGGE